MKHVNRKAWITALLLSVLAAALTGCGEKADTVLSLGQEETKVSEAGEQEASDGEEDAGTAQDQQTADGAGDVSALQGSDASGGAEGADAAGGQDVSGAAESAGDAVLSDAAEGTMAVYVCGAVAAPGVYEVAEDMRLVDAVELAGGFLADADTTWWNLAGKLSDGAMYYIPTVSETADEDFSLPSGEGGTDGNGSGGALSGNAADDGVPEDSGSAESGGQTGEPADGAVESTASDGLVSINTATKEELTALPGIGDTKAAAIITYRETNGPFTAIDEIMNVTGIGESTYEKLKDCICL